MCMMSDGQISTHSPQPSHLVMSVEVGIRSAPDAVVFSRRPWKIRGAVCLLDPPLERYRGLKEHMGEFRPGHGNKEQRREENVEPEQYPRRGRVRIRRLHVIPGKRKRDARDERTDKQVSPPQVKRRNPVIRYVYPEEEEKPQTTDENHQSA